MRSSNRAVMNCPRSGKQQQHLNSGWHLVHWQVAANILYFSAVSIAPGRVNRKQAPLPEPADSTQIRP